MSVMLEFYGLREQPFGISPNPRFSYPAAQHREALASLIYGIENQVGFAALIAAPGIGKTTLLFDILLRYRDRASTAFVFNTQCTGLELLRHIVMELQVPGGESEHDPVRLHQLFTSFAADRVRNKPVVIIIDEAQNLESSALETLRLLSNFEAADRKLVHIILAGQPQLGEKLRSPGLTQLLQRITTISRLETLSPAQTEECIAHRLRVAGYAGVPLFATEAMAKIKTASGGVPREINRICMNALRLGFALRQRRIGAEVIAEVLSDLELGCEPRTAAAKGLPEPKPVGIEGIVPSAPVELCFSVQSPARPLAQASVVPQRQAAKHSAERGQRKPAQTGKAAYIGTVAAFVSTALVLLAAASFLHQPQSLAAGNVSAGIVSTAIPAPKTSVNLEPSVQVRAARKTKHPVSAEPDGSNASLAVEPTVPSFAIDMVHRKPGATQSEEQGAMMNPGAAYNSRDSRKASANAEQAAQMYVVNVALQTEQSAPTEPDTGELPGAEWPVAPNIPRGADRDVPSKRDVAQFASLGLTAPPGVPSSSADFRKAADDRRTPSVKFVRPVYPLVAKKTHLEGDVSLQVGVASDGSVQHVSVLSGNPVLAQAAKEAVQQWRYQPSVLKGTAVALEQEIIVSFREHQNRD